MSRDEFEAEGGGGVVQAGQLLALHSRRLLAKDVRVEGFPVFEQRPEDARQFVRHRADRLWGSQPRLSAPVEVAKIVLRLVESLRRLP